MPVSHPCQLLASNPALVRPTPMVKENLLIAQEQKRTNVSSAHTLIPQSGCTQTLPLSRAARELYFSANSDFLIVNRREVSFLCLPFHPITVCTPNPHPQFNTPHNSPARQGAQDTKHSSQFGVWPSCSCCLEPMVQ